MPPKTTTYRLFEILPGALTWLTFTLPLILAFIAPKWVSIFIMIYGLYWFMRTMTMSYHLILGYRRYRDAKKRHWRQELENAFPEEYKKVKHLVLVPMYKE